MKTVSDLILDILPRLQGPPTGTTVYQAVNLINSLLSKRLLSRKSDLMRLGTLSISLVSEGGGNSGGSSVLYDDGTTATYDDGSAMQYDGTTGAVLYRLPADFISLAEEPFIADVSRRPLEPLDCHRSLYNGRTADYPDRYELAGTQIYFYPALDPLATPPIVKARYYTAPPVLSQPTDIIPFNGMFDQVYFQGVPRAILRGLSVIQADPDFEAFVNSEVDMVLNARMSPVPNRRMKRSSWI